MTRPPTQTEIDYGCALDIAHSTRERRLIIALRIIAAVVIVEAIVLALCGSVP